ncbi:sensor histidine kinase [Desulfocurvus sp. DL9XJH121]
MSGNWDVLGPEGLAFFGAICASVSHELKNSLAMINENAGLMQDLLAMAERGRPLDSAMLAIASERIARHVAKANQVIGNLNRFAHLADHPVLAVDLAEDAALAVALHGRLAAQREVELTLAPAAGEVPLRTRPFLLADILHRCLVLALDNAASGSVSVEVAAATGGAEVRLTGLADNVSFPEDAASELLRALGARVTCDGTTLTLVLGDLGGHDDAQ